MSRVIRHDFRAGTRSLPTWATTPVAAATSATASSPADAPAAKIRWSGRIKAVQPRAWVWRYKADNRNHTHTGYNLWIVGKGGTTVVAISALQQAKLAFRIGDEAQGSGWPVQGNKREVADLYRAGDLKVLARGTQPDAEQGPPFTGPVLPPEVYKQRGCRMLDPTRWRTTCLSCKWACKSRVEIEFVWGKQKRYRSETFCYGPKSCPLYEMGPPREVPYRHEWKSEASSSTDDGSLDSCITSGRDEDD